eukprot:6045702-Amphidinium_carterae.1
MEQPQTPAVMPFSSPLRDKSSEIVAQHMVEVESSLRMQQKLLALGVTQSFSPPHQPQSNGLAERM